MHPKRQDIYRSTSRVIGWVDDVLKVQAGQNVLDHGGVVINLADPLR
jgi:hypothetical protein